MTTEEWRETKQRNICDWNKQTKSMITTLHNCDRCLYPLQNKSLKWYSCKIINTLDGKQCHMIQNITDWFVIFNTQCLDDYHVLFIVLTKPHIGIRPTGHPYFHLMLFYSIYLFIWQNIQLYQNHSCQFILFFLLMFLYKLNIPHDIFHFSLVFGTSTPDTVQSCDFSHRHTHT